MFRFALITLSCFFALNLANAQLNIDSVKNVIKNAKHDTVRIKAYLDWDNVIYLQDSKLDIELNEKIGQLCEKNLKRTDLTKNESKYFKASLAISHNNIGLALNEQNLYPEAIENFREGLKMAKSVKNENLESMFYNNLGISYRGLRKYQEAVHYYDLCLEVQKGTSDTEFVADTYNNIGLIYFDMNKPDEALKYYFKSIALRDTVKINKGLADAYHNVGVILLREGKTQEAYGYFSKSVKIFHDFSYYQGESNSVVEIGNALRIMGKYNQSLEKCEYGYSLAKKHEIVPSLHVACECMYKTYRALKQFDKALQYHEEYALIEDSLQLGEQRVVLERTEAQTEFKLKSERLKQEQRQQKLLARAESRRQRIIIYAVSAGFLGVLILAFVILRSLRENKRKNKIISEQKLLVETKQQEVVDSINYARRLQEAILPSLSDIQQAFPEFFICYLPKDIVAGDFYWMDRQSNGTILFSVADCTGHGVPGAMVSVVCSNALNRTVQEFRKTEPGEILDKTRELVLETFEASHSAVNDGMDAALISVKKTGEKEYEIKFSGANNPLWIIRKNSNTVEEIKGDKQPVGRYENTKPFQTHSLIAQSGDTVYLFSDGYPDQFGGENLHTGKSGGKKLKTVYMKKLLLSIQHKTMQEQGEYMHDAFIKWQGDLEQIDDVCLMGIKLV